MASNSYGLPDDDGNEPNVLSGMVRMPDDGGGAVTPQSATPSMAKGGAIPDEDEELGSNAGVEDDTTTHLNGALQKVQQALMFGRQQSGLPGGGGSSGETQPQEEQVGVPDDEGDGEAYAEGGAIGDDIEASNNATDDGPQYGRPEVVDDPDAVRPPISSNNTDYADVPEQTAIPQEQAPVTPAASGGDESGALPATPPVNDESGAGPVAAGQAPPRSGGIPDDALPHNLLRNGVQSIIGYLQGKGAMANEQAIALEQSVTPAAKNDPAAVPVLATAAAGTPEQQFGYIQRNRQIYDATMAHGRAALNGVEGRPPSLDVAIEDATKAFAKVPDGENVHFVKHGDGVVAQVSGASGREQRGYPLTVQQFGQLLDTGKDGMFDRMMAPGGVRRVLGSFTEQQPAQQDGAASNPYLQRRLATGAPGGGGQSSEAPLGPLGAGDAAGRPGAMTARNDSDREITMGHDQTLLRASPQYKQQNPNWGKAPENLNARTRVINGSDDRNFIGSRDQTPTEQDKKLEQIRAKNEGRGTIDDKLKLEDRKGANRIAAEEAKGKYKTQHEDRLDARSEANRGSREKMAASKLVEQAKSREATNGRNADSIAERLLASKLLAGQKLTPQEQARADRVIQGGGQQQAQQQAPAQQQQQQQSSQAQQALLWANANPNDPRAARIKQLHGVQ